MNTRRKLLLALAILAVPVAVYAGKSDRYGRDIIAYEEPIDDAGTWTRSAPLPVTGTIKITSTDGGMPFVKNHEQGWSKTKSQCQRVLCSTAGDGGVITVTIGARYLEKVIDQNGSPVDVVPNAPCVAFGNSATGGEMINPGEIADNVVPFPVGGDAGLTTTQYTCCAQTQTTTAGQQGPWLQYCPLQ